MLNEAEQRRLIQIESSLRTEDPRFTRRFEAQAQRGERRRWQLLVTMLAVVAAVVGVAVGLAVGSTAMVVAAVTGLGAATGLLITHRHAW